MPNDTNNPVKIEMVAGVEGSCLVMLDHRFAGPKPWGGGSVVKIWNATIENILEAIATNQKEDKQEYRFWYNANYKVTVERISNEE